VRRRNKPDDGSARDGAEPIPGDRELTPLPPDLQDPAKPKVRRSGPEPEFLERALPIVEETVRSPAFAYGLAALLAIPALLYFVDGRSAESTEPRTVAAAPAAVEVPAPAVTEPRARALRMLGQYEAALRARNLERLRDVWEMSDEEEAALRDIFEEARIVSPLIDLQHVEIPVGAEDGSLRIVFAQVLTLARGASQFYARGPHVYEADVVRGPGFDFWMMRNRREVKDSPPPR